MAMALLQKQKGSKNWYAVIYDRDPKTGEQVQKWKSTRTDNKVQAKIAMRSILEEYEFEVSAQVQQVVNSTIVYAPVNAHHNEEVENPILFVDMMREWVKEGREGSLLEDTTFDSYEPNVNNHIVPFFEPLGLYAHEVRRKHIQQFINHLHTKGRLNGKGGLKVTSIRKFVANISVAFKNGIQDGHAKMNPCEHVMYAAEEEYEAEVLNADELIKLLDAVRNTTIETAIVLAVYYAFRRGEILGLRWSDIDFENDIIQIKNTRVRIGVAREKGPKSKASKRPLPLLPIVKSYLLDVQEKQRVFEKQYGNNYHKNDYVVKWEDGKPFDHAYANKKLQEILVKNNLPKRHLHELRHSNATLLSTRGRTIFEIQSWLRHGSTKSTQRYTHNSFENSVTSSKTIEENLFFGK